MEISLTPEAVCSIIDTCSAKGVSVLQFGPLHIVFGQPAPRTPAPESAVALDEQLPVKAMTEIQHNKQTAEAIEADEVRMMQDRLDQMFIENPLLAEELVRDGELEDADDSDDAE